MELMEEITCTHQFSITQHHFFKSGMSKRQANRLNIGDGWVGQCYGPHYIFALHEMTKLEESPHDPERWNAAQPTDDPNWLENSSADVGWPSSSLHVALSS